MRLAEAASRNNAVLPSTGDGSGVTGGAQGAAPGQFASVLSATRRSSQGLMDLLLPREAEPDRHRDRKAEAASKQALDRSKDAKLQREQASKPGRAEQLQSLERERTARATSGEADRAQLETGDAQDGATEQPVEARPAEPIGDSNLGGSLGRWTESAVEPAGAGQAPTAGNPGGESAGSAGSMNPSPTTGESSDDYDRCGHECEQSCIGQRGVGRRDSASRGCGSDGRFGRRGISEFARKPGPRPCK
jgi:hypothetical protein